ncbi:MAG TPA: dienelactone hydrolase family protein [Hyphomicrobium sp.]|nr:dienelactone hydrolase family protein [Hyphomicrobium sp.]
MPVAAADSQYGSFGPEGPRLREQWWILPSADQKQPLRATVFRPADPPEAEGKETRHPLVVINHGTSDATRLAVGMPVYYWLSRWFVERGYVVLLPQRRGHGATGGQLAESIGSCADPDHYSSGLAAAADIRAAMAYMTKQPFVAPDETIVVGISSGGWASLALASQSPKNVRAVINIAGGRGGRPFGRTDRSVCGEQGLLAAAHSYGQTARVPTLWLYASNDTFFRPDLARAMASAWRDGGGKAELHMFPPYGTDGHNLADDRAGWDVWGAAVDHFLTEDHGTPVAALDSALPVEQVKATGTKTSAGVLTSASANGETRAP